MQIRSCFVLTAALVIACSTLISVLEAKESVVAVECGDIIEGEFTDTKEGHIYEIAMEPGDRVDFSIVPVGEYLRWIIRIYDPGGSNIFNKAIGCSLPSTSAGKTGVLSGRGVYKIRISNFLRCAGNGTLGVYTLHIGCTLRDGNVIKPGFSPRSAPPSKPSSAPSKTIPEDFKGFPGLAPIDFSDSAFPKLSLGIPLEGTISTGNEVFGYRFDANQGESVDLNFKKESGNLNLGLVLLDQRSQVVFHSSLVITKTLTARLLLPTTGEYTLGVVRIELLPPSAPSTTSFTVEISRFR